jgi:hypothetical protein
MRRELRTKGANATSYFENSKGNRRHSFYLKDPYKNQIDHT